MDRHNRRFVPRSEGLEGRQLMATASSAATALTAPATTTTSLGSLYGATNVPAGTQIDGSAPVADTIEAKLQHIQNYPYFIGMLNRDGDVPQPAVGNIQQDLLKLIGTMHPGNTTTTYQFNLDLRDDQNTYNITQDQATALNRDFGATLLAAGADPQVTADLQEQMNSLAQQATQQSDPSIVARNEYSTTLQLALGTGRPLLAPATPSLTSASRHGTSKGLAVTNLAEPSLTGSYAAGTQIQIVDANNTVFGFAATAANGTYTVKFANPLPDGTYTVRVRAADLGYYSPPSKSFTFVVALPKAKAK